MYDAIETLVTIYDESLPKHINRVRINSNVTYILDEFVNKYLFTYMTQFKQHKILT